MWPWPGKSLVGSRRGRGIPSKINVKRCILRHIYMLEIRSIIRSTRNVVIITKFHFSVGPKKKEELRGGGGGVTPAPLDPRQGIDYKCYQEKLYWHLKNSPETVCSLWICMMLMQEGTHWPTEILAQLLQDVLRYISSFQNMKWDAVLVMTSSWSITWVCFFCNGTVGIRTRLVWQSCRYASFRSYKSVEKSYSLSNPHYHCQYR